MFYYLYSCYLVDGWSWCFTQILGTESTLDSFTDLSVELLTHSIVILIMEQDFLNCILKY